MMKSWVSESGKNLIFLNKNGEKKMKAFETIEGGICAAKGFKASGVYCGISDIQILIRNSA